MTASKGPGTDWYRLRQIWLGIKKRTCNPSNKDYGHYSGMGVTLCDEWQEFETFYNWAMQNGYRSDLTLDRIRNTNGPYAPWNCRWISRKAQAYNRTTNHPLRASDGRIRTVIQWSKITGTPESTIRRRIQMGWSVDEAVGLKKHEKEAGPRKKA